MVPQISVIMIEPQAILAGSGEAAKGNFNVEEEITSGDKEEGIWDTI